MGTQEERNIEANIKCRLIKRAIEKDDSSYGLSEQTRNTIMTVLEMDEVREVKTREVKADE